MAAHKNFSHNSWEDILKFLNAFQRVENHQKLAKKVSNVPGLKKKKARSSQEMKDILAHDIEWNFPTNLVPSSQEFDKQYKLEYKGLEGIERYNDMLMQPEEYISVAERKRLPNITEQEKQFNLPSYEK